MRSRVIAFILILVPSLALAKVGGSDALVTFKLREGSYYAEIARRNWPAPKEVKLCQADALDRASNNHRLYEQSSCSDVYKCLISPLKPYIGKGETIFFVPAGKIYFLNLAAIFDDSGKRLLETYHFHRLSSADEYSSYTDKLEKYAEWYLFGGMDYLADPEKMFRNCWWCHTHNIQHRYEDRVTLDDVSGMSFGTAEDGTRAGYSNLEYSKKEIKDILAIRSSVAHHYTGYRACEEIFKQTVGIERDYIIHLSTHTFTLDGTGEDGAVCGLLFSGAGHTIGGAKMPHGLNDGILFAAEIETLDMSHASLVVLAACNTGLGVVSQDGIKGLQSAFKKAGAKTLVLTLWSVNDKATAFFSSRLFYHLDKGRSKFESFERARNDMIASQEFSAPDYWVPFILLD